jgi:hypothetical protein
MYRKTAALFSLFGAGLLFTTLGIGANLVPMAAAQMPNICPPGQTFVIAAGQVRDGAARGQMPGGSGVRRSDESLRDAAVGGQMPGGPGVRRSDEPLRDAAVGGQMPGGPGVRRSGEPLRDALTR